MEEKTEEGLVYERLADALDRLPNGFPRTPSNAEIPMLRRLFSVAEAELALELSGRMEPLAAIAERAGLTAEEAGERLTPMAKRGLVWYSDRGPGPRFRIAPFLVGIYEGHREEIDHEFSHLFEQYMLDGGMAGIMGAEPAIHRVLPARKAEKTELILPYEDVRAILETAETFRESECICRKQRELIGHGCGHPKGMCLGFSASKSPELPGEITREEALALLDRAQEAGLVHAVSNNQKGIGYICNCCGCCCAVLRGITQFGLENSVARASYRAVIDPEDCLVCGLCIERCHVDAIEEVDGVICVDPARCIGCGLCATSCPSESARLERRPDSETVEPPENFRAWESERLKNRGTEA